MSGAPGGPAADAPGHPILEAAGLLIRTGVLSASGHGNASVRLDDGSLTLTGRSSLSGLRAEHLATVDPSGAVVDGTVEPANLEIIDMHTAVYRRRPDVRAVVHTHSPNLTAFALAHRALPSRYESTIRFGLVDDVPVAPWGARGSQVAVDHITATLEGHPAALAILLANHGVLAFGPDAMTTARLIVALEEAALIERAAVALGGSQPFPPGALEAVQAGMERFAPGSGPRGRG